MQEWKEFVYMGLSMLFASFIIFIAIQIGGISKEILAESNRFSHTQDIIKEYRTYSSFNNTEIEVVELEYMIDRSRGNMGVFIFTDRLDWENFILANDKKLTKSPAQVGVVNDYLMYSKIFNTPESEYDMILVDSKLMDMCGGNDRYLTRKFSSLVVYDDGGQALYIATYLMKEEP